MKEYCNSIHLCFLCVFCFLPLSLSAQSNKNFNKQEEKLIKRVKGIADEFFRIGEYDYALNAYEDIDSIMPNQPEIMYKLGVCHLYTQSIDKAIAAFEYANLLPGIPPELDFYWARALHSKHQFEEAIAKYKLYIKSRHSGHGDQAVVKLEEVDRLIEQCETGIEFVKKPMPNITITNLGPDINSPFDDFAPLISRDESLLIFTSSRKTDQEIENPFTGNHYEDVFYSKKQGEKWSKAENIGSTINASGVHDAAVGLSPDGQKLIVSRGNDDLIRFNDTGDLYIAELTDSGWSTPQFMESAINSSYWEPSASITEDENAMFFTSDRPGGFGGRDIYMMKKLPNGDWATPFNLGPTINTSADEDGPFIHPDGNKLYFSSNGHRGMGGFDIYFSEFNEEKKKWSEPRNMGYPINTALDDIFFVWSPDGERAYFSSKREDSFGRSDIYVISRVMSEFANVVLTGGVYDAETQQPVEVTLAIRDRFNNFVTGTYSSEAQSGNVSMVLRSGSEYVIEVVNGNYTSNNLVISIPEYKEFKNIEQNIYLVKSENQ